MHEHLIRDDLPNRRLAGPSRRCACADRPVAGSAPSPRRIVAGRRGVDSASPGGQSPCRAMRDGPRRQHPASPQASVRDGRAAQEGQQCRVEGAGSHDGEHPDDGRQAGPRSRLVPVHRRGCRGEAPGGSGPGPDGGRGAAATAATRPQRPRRGHAGAGLAALSQALRGLHADRPRGRCGRQRPHRRVPDRLRAACPDGLQCAARAAPGGQGRGRRGGAGLDDEVGRQGAPRRRARGGSCREQSSPATSSWWTLATAFRRTGG